LGRRAYSTKSFDNNGVRQWQGQTTISQKAIEMGVMGQQRRQP
jgi:hypothetical protein